MNRNIVVVGGGRWARVIIESLCGLVSPSAEIRVCSLHNAQAVSAWAASRELTSRIVVTTAWPKIDGNNPPAVIVVNAARDHFAAAQIALRAGAPVLIEKPVALNAKHASELFALTESRQIRLAAAHVFLFSRYFDNFRKLIVRSGALRQIRFKWTDPRNESRYGEVKSYDPSLPVYADWLPHILSMIGSLMPGIAPEIIDLEFYRGGAQLSLELAYGNSRCLLELSRNSERRERLLEVVSLDGSVYRLDFSLEPGTIEADGISSVGDSYWNAKARPVASMLKSFLSWADGGESDWRLDFKAGLLACKMIDQVGICYKNNQVAWVKERLKFSDGIDDDDLHYALTEMRMLKSDVSGDSIHQQIFDLRQDTSWLGA